MRLILFICSAVLLIGCQQSVSTSRQEIFGIAVDYDVRPATLSQVEQLMSEFTEAYMGKDRHALSNILSEDFTWYLHEGDGDSPKGKVVHGVEGMLGELKLRANRWQDVAYTEIQVYATKSMITQTFRIQGTDIEQGNFDRYGVDLYQIRGGKIVSKNSHWKGKREQ